MKNKADWNFFVVWPWTHVPEWLGPYPMRRWRDGKWEYRNALPHEAEAELLTGQW